MRETPPILFQNAKNFRIGQLCCLRKSRLFGTPKGNDSVKPSSIQRNFHFGEMFWPPEKVNRPFPPILIHAFRLLQLVYWVPLFLSSPFFAPFGICHPLYAKRGTCLALSPPLLYSFVPPPLSELDVFFGRTRLSTRFPNYLLISWKKNFYLHFL